MARITCLHHGAMSVQEERRGTETIGVERAESDIKRCRWSAGEVHGFLHEPSRVCRISQIKCPTENRWASIFGGGGGN